MTEEENSQRDLSGLGEEQLKGWESQACVTWNSTPEMLEVRAWRGSSWWRAAFGKPQFPNRS